MCVQLPGALCSWTERSHMGQAWTDLSMLPGHWRLLLIAWADLFNPPTNIQGRNVPSLSAGWRAEVVLYLCHMTNNSKYLTENIERYVSTAKIFSYIFSPLPDWSWVSVSATPCDPCTTWSLHPRWGQRPASSSRWRPYRRSARPRQASALRYPAPRTIPPIITRNSWRAGRTMSL